MTDLLHYQFFRLAILAVALISIASAIIGTYIVTRRIVSICGGITHACFGGLGIGYFLGINPFIPAAAFAIFSSLAVQALSDRCNIRQDSAIALIWSIGMAIGVLFIFITPGYVPDLTSFLFGNILTISIYDLYAFAAYLLILCVFFIAFHKTILYTAFDPDFARVRHLPVNFISYSMAILIGAAIVLTIRLVGIMLLMSIISLPVLTAETFCSRYSTLIIASILISLTASLAGLFLGAFFAIPSSVFIVLILAAAFFSAKFLPIPKKR